MRLWVSNAAISIAFFLAGGCSAQQEPTMHNVEQTFVQNRNAFEDAVKVIYSINLKERRVEIDESSELARDLHIASIFRFKPVPVERIIVYPQGNDGLSIDFLIYASGLSVGGKSWSLEYNSVFTDDSSDKAIAFFPSCSGVDLKHVVETDPIVLSAECLLEAPWSIEYSAS